MDHQYPIFNEVAALKELHDVKIVHLKEITDLHFKLNQIARDKSELEMKLKLEGQNEWRDQNKDIISTLASKDEVRALSKLVYIGFGILLALEALLKVLPIIH